ncbi:hypothetical protein CL635_00535 [bacterium]|nr:hypothetical protein [bacterium]
MCVIIFWFSLVIWSCIGIFGCSSKQDPYTTWETYQGDPGSNQYSSLGQINKGNVDQLEVVWVYQTGDSLGQQSQIQCNSIIVDDILYATSPAIKLIALQAATGELLWEFDPALDFSPHVNRGVTYWESGNDKRILFTAGSLLFAIDAITGKPVVSFGTEGVTSLKAGLGARAADLFVISTTPGVIYKNLYIIGTRVSENADAAPGYIRAFNARTGAVEWVFNTIPKPGEYGYDTWPKDAYGKIGGANAWAGISLDVERGVVYAPTGSADLPLTRSFDHIDLGLISIPSIFYGSAIKKGTVDLKFYWTGSLIARAQDINHNGELIHTQPVGSNGSGSVVGIVLYNEGMIILTGSEAFGKATDYYISGAAPDYPKWIYFAGETIQRTTGSTNSAYIMNMSGTTKTPTMTIFAGAAKGQWNHSNNPSFRVYSSNGRPTTTSPRSYIENDNIQIKNVVSSSFPDPTGSFAKTTYISKIGLYDKDYNLIALAKPSTPIRKTAERDFTFKLKLDL